MKKTLVLGASTNPERYAYKAVERLTAAGHEVVAIGLKTGNIGDTPIQQGTPDIADLDSVTLYLGAAHQSQYYDYIFSLHPKRIIFNPGAENPDLLLLAQEKGIETTVGCTLVMLSIGNY
jgi:uncharacterized protein